MQSSRAYPTAPDVAYERVLATDMTAWMSSRYLVFPAVSAVTDLEGTWGSHVGQTRRLLLSDRGSVLETLVVVAPGEEFAYELSEISGPLRLVASCVRGRFLLEPVGTGVRVTWSWDIVPTRLGTPVLPLLARVWRGWARRALADLEPRLVG